MRYDSLDQLEPDRARACVTIGVFDGVHLGHRHVIARTMSAAPQGLPIVAVTFDPHPMMVLRPEAAPVMLSTVDHRVLLLEDAGVDDVVVLPFTRELSALTAEEFVEQVLVAKLRAQSVTVGENFRFGHRAAGTVDTLRELGEQYDFSVDAVALVGDKTVNWSSTFVRECVAAGDVDEAAQVLTRPHRVEGEVVHGDHRGRDLGYPTANLRTPGGVAIPGDGVYAGWLVRTPYPSPQPFAAAISIGTNPTFDGTARRVEAFVLDRDDLELYGEHVAVDFVQRLRPTLKFDGVDELLTQMAKDVEQAREITAIAQR